MKKKKQSEAEAKTAFFQPKDDKFPLLYIITITSFLNVFFFFFLLYIQCNSNSMVVPIKIKFFESKKYVQTGN
jgi:hypothetical protein